MSAIFNYIRRLFRRNSGNPNRGPLVEIVSLILKRRRWRKILPEMLADNGSPCMALGLVFEYLKRETDVLKAAEVLRVITSPAVVKVFKEPLLPHDCLALDRMLGTACRYCTLYCDPEASQEYAEEELKEVCLAAVEFCDYLILPLANRTPGQPLSERQLAMVLQAIGVFSKVMVKVQKDWPEKGIGLLSLFMERVAGIVEEDDLKDDELRNALLTFVQEVPGVIRAAGQCEKRAWRVGLQVISLGPDQNGLTPSSRLWQYAMACDGHRAFEYARDVTAAMLCFLDDSTGGMCASGISSGDAEIVAGCANAFVKQCCNTGSGTAEPWNSYVRPLIADLARRHRDALLKDCKRVHEYLGKMLKNVDRLSDASRAFRPHDRVRVDIKATISGDPRGDHPGSILNLSRTGCLFRFFGGAQDDIDANAFSDGSMALEFENEGQPCHVGILRAIEHEHREAVLGEVVLGLKFSEELSEAVFEAIVRRSDGVLV